MKANTSIVHSQNLPQGQSGELLRFSRQEVGWEWMSLVIRRLVPGDTLPLQTQDEEMALVLLGGECAADWGEGEVLIGGRKNVFDGPPYALYLPSSNRVVLKAESVCEFAECKVPSTASLQPRLITPKDISSNLRGGENASRQIIDVIQPDFPADKLVVVEVYTPGGNWSSYPPHKHEVHNPPVEVDLDEIYYYRMKSPRAFGFQNLYSSDNERDSILKVRDGDAVLVRDGYHPVVAGPGYDIYYLNFLAGTSRAMMVTEDPDHVWLRSSWKQPDARLPMVRNGRPDQQQGPA
jgi:5-deoxy-glucuronate isomerase